MQNALIAGMIIGLLALFFVAKLLHDLLSSLRPLERNVDAISAQRRVVEALPTRVAEEVRKGLEPVNGSVQRLTEESQQVLKTLGSQLANSHEHLDRVLLTLDRDGYMGDWVTSFRETAEPFQLATQALTAHYETSGKLLSTTGELARYWSEEREAVQDAFSKFSEMVERSAASEAHHLQTIEHRVMSRLEEVAETNSTVSHALSELQTASRHTLEAHESLSDTVRSTVDKVSELLDLGHRTQAQHHELIRAQETVQQRVVSWHDGMEQRIGRFQKHLEETPVRIGAAFKAQVEGAVKAFGTLGGKLDNLHKEQTRHLQETARHQSSVVEQHGKLIEQQKNVLAELRRTLGLLPNRNLQLAALALLAAQTVMLGVLIFVLAS